MVETVVLPISASLTAVGANVVTAVCDTACGLNGKYFSLTEAFCIQMGLPNPKGIINAASMVFVGPNRNSGTVVTMDAAFQMNQNRPTSGYRIDLQHYNSQDPDTRIQKCCNFHVQTNTANKDNSVSIASVHIQFDAAFAPSYVMDAFKQSLQGRRPIMLLK